MPVLGLPILLVGLAALPMLAGIYWLRTRYRRQDVSALFLWQSAVQAQGGGRKKSRMQTPLALFLELFIIALLVLAATTPRLFRSGQTASVVVVLDDSYSMLAQGDDGVSSRGRAIDALRDALASLPGYTVRLVRAGRTSHVLGKPCTRWEDVASALRSWQCEATFVDMNGALALASEVGGPRTRILVLSDHPMPDSLRGGDAGPSDAHVSNADAESNGSPWGRLWWLSVGRPIDNVAIVNAVRSYDATQGDVILVELANHGDQQNTSTLTLSAGTPESIFVADSDAPVLGSALDTLSSQTVTLEAGQVKRFWLKPEEVKGRPVMLSLGRDALEADNRAVLMPTVSVPLEVSLLMDDPALRRATDQAVRASGRARVVGQGAQLVFTDQPATAGSVPAGAGWVVRFDRGDPSDPPPEAQAFLGPFVIDYEHPLSEGLSLTGVVWSVAGQAGVIETARTARGSGRPVIAAGDEVLLADRRLSDGRHELVWRFWPERSTMLQSPAFPVLVWNLLQWRKADLPGVSSQNVQSGVPIKVTTSRSQDEILIRRVDAGLTDANAGDSKTLSALDRRVVFSPERPGVYEVLAGEDRYRIAVNAMSSDESDLRRAVGDTFGQWDDQLSIEREYRDVSWLLGLFALGALGTHAFWLGRGTVRGSRGRTG